MADAALGSLSARQVDQKNFAAALMRGDVAMGLGAIGLVVLMITPLPAFLLDFLLVISITLSVWVLMTALMTRTALEFSSFPTVLLIATLFRLGLNIASTRLILSHGHEGEGAAGKIIGGFGHFMTGDNFAIGVIIFAILVIVNFVVITKGATRIAEVSARFSLDSMPGKQMAIDADLSAGLISEDVARERRKTLEAESTFFGSMDGASKFVRGDAVAGLMITAINIVGGIAIGVLQQGISLSEAGSTYTQLTIGDGLVTQIPALVISIAAGLLVSKAGVDGAADKALADQFLRQPQGLALAGMTAAVAGMLPGMPMLPFAIIAGACGVGAWNLTKRDAKIKTDAAAALPPPAEPVEEPIQTALALDELKIELGFGLLPLIHDVEGRRLTDQIKALRRQLAGDLGVVIPSVRILDNLQLVSEEYCIRVKEMEAGRGRLKLHHLLIMDPSGQVSLPGEQVKEPVFGLPALWVEQGLREEAVFRNCTVVDPATVLTTHLTEILKEHVPDLLNFAAVQKLIKDLPKEHQKLVEDIVPGQISHSGIQRVLQTLLREHVSIRDLPAILEGIAEAVGSTSDLIQITEHVRARLARQICHANRSADGSLPVITLSPQWEEAFAEALVGEREKVLALPPSKLHEFVAGVRAAYDNAAAAGETPALLTSGGIRPYVRSLIERFRPQTVVMSQNEIHPKARLKSFGSI
ncbi:MAG: flagellar biosynthesis protein FlhA [Caulobacterales bacterium]